jgi:hypothetical protein
LSHGKYEGGFSLLRQIANWKFFKDFSSPESQHYPEPTHTSIKKDFLSGIKHLELVSKEPLLLSVGDNDQWKCNSWHLADWNLNIFNFYSVVHPKETVT